MANGNIRQIDQTRKEFLNDFRSRLPPRYQLLSDDQLATFLFRLKPEFANVEFKPEPVPEPSLPEAVSAGVKEFAYRLPETAASTFNTLTSANDTPEMIEYRANLYKWARSKTEEWIENDPQTKAMRNWAAENPFEWGKFFTSGAMFGQIVTQAVTSMGTIMASGAIGALLTGGHPLGAFAGASIAGGVLEGSEAFDSAVTRAGEKGMSKEEIDKIASESYLLYGGISAALEPLVPLSIMKSFGLGSRVAKATFGKYASNYLDDIVRGAKSSPGTAIKAMQRTAEQNLSITRRIMDMGRFVGIEQLGEATTEATQFLAEQAILDNKIDGTQIDLDWLARQWKNPELHASIAGGAVGGGIFSTPTGFRKARGVSGKEAAESSHALLQAVPNEEVRNLTREKLVGDILSSPDFTNIDKVEFSRRMIELERIEATEDIPIIPAQKPIEKAVERPTIEDRPKEGIVIIEKKKAIEPVTGRKFDFLEQYGGPLPDRSLKWYLASGNARGIINKLAPDDKKILIDLLGVGIEKLADKKISDSVGNFNEAKVLGIADRLKKEGRRVTEKRGMEIPGTPEDIKSVLTEEIIGDIAGIEEEVTTKAIGDVTGIIEKLEAERKGIQKRREKEAKEIKPKKEEVITRLNGAEPLKFEPGPLEKRARGEIKPKPDQGIVLSKIISGGQFGADVGALIGARKVGIETGGTAPANFLTEKGSQKILARYGLVEGPKGKNVAETYRIRTIQNIKDSDGTLIMGREGSPGTILTLNELERQGKPYIVNPTKKEFTNWLKANEIKTLNVAGPRESKEGGLQARVTKFIENSLKIKPEKPIAQKKTPIAPGQLRKSQKKAAKAKKEVVKAKETREKIIIKTQKIKKVEQSKIGSKEDNTGAQVDQDITELYSPEIQKDLEIFHTKQTYEKNKTVLGRLGFEPPSFAKILANFNVNIADLFKEEKLNSVLKKLSETSKDEGNKLLAKWLYKNLKNEDFLVRINRLYGAAGRFEPSLGLVLLSPLSLDIEKTLLHEAIHALTIFRIQKIKRSGPKDPGYKIYEDLINLTKNTSNYLENQNPEEYSKAMKVLSGDLKVSDSEWFYFRQRYYGIYNLSIDEFITESLTNDTFQNILISIKIQKNYSFWDRLIRLIKKIIGMDVEPNTALSVAFKNVIHLTMYPQVTYKEVKTIRPSSPEDEMKDLLDLERTEDEQSDIFSELITERYSGDPFIAMKSFFLNAYGVYVPRESYPKLTDVARRFKNKSFREKENFDAYVADFEQTLTEVTGQTLPERRKKQHYDWLKGWYQHVNSTIENDYSGKKVGFVRHPMEIIIEKTDKTKRGYDSIAAIRIKPEMNRLHKNRSNPFSELSNFAEEDILKNIPNMFWIVSDKDIFIRDPYETEDGIHYDYSLADRGDIELTGDTIDKIDQFFADEYSTAKDKTRTFLRTFFAETKGDNSKIIITYVPHKYAEYGQEEFYSYLDDEVRVGNMAPIHRQIMKNTVKYTSKNEYSFAQAMGVHEAWKKLKGRAYLMRELDENGNFNPKKTVMMAHKRLKLDMSEGWIPRGIGSSSVMVFDPKEVSITMPDQNGKDQEVDLIFEDNRYSMDGWMMYSAYLMSKITKVAGTHSDVYKPVIRYRDPNRNGLDYINFKHSAQIPQEGSKVYRTINKERQLVAEYKDGIWKDIDGNVFEILASTEEAKERDGSYKDNYKILPLPEDSIRILQTYDKSADMGAHPIIGEELILDSGYLEDSIAFEYLKFVMVHYSNMAHKYMNELYSFRDSPEKLVEFLQTTLKEGQIPSDVQQYILADKTGKSLFLQNPIRQIILILTNHFIRDGYLKMRSMGKSTHLILKPRGGYQFKDDKSIIISAKNNTMVDIVKQKAELKDVNIDKINEWLSKNDFWVLIHRQPIQGFTKVQPRKLQEFVLGRNGQTAFVSEKDVFRVHEGDFDGDAIFVEYIDDSPLIDRMRDMIWDENGNYKKAFIKRDHTIYLEIFEKGPLGQTQASRKEARDVMTNNVILHALQGHAVTAKTILAVFGYKNISFSLRSLSGDIKINSYNPQDRVLIDYWEINENAEDFTNIKTRLEAEGDIFVRIGDKLFLETTKENEFSLLLQAAVDNEKFGLWAKIPKIKELGVHRWLLTRIFKRTDNKPIIPVSWFPGKKDNTVSILNSLSDVYRAFNYGRDRRAVDLKQRQQDLFGIFRRSKNILEDYYETSQATLEDIRNVGKNFNSKFKLDVSVTNSNLENRINMMIAEIIDESSDRIGNIYNLKTNGYITPVEWLLMQSYLYNQYHINNADNNGIKLNSPVQVDEDTYNTSHVNAMARLKLKWSKEFAEDKLTSKEFQKVLDLSREFNKKFYDRYDNIEGRNVINREKAEEFDTRWFKEFHINPDMNWKIHKWVTIMFLRGAKIEGFRGARRGTLMSLPAMYLVYRPAFVEYGKAMYEEMFKPNEERQIISPELGEYELTRTLKEFKDKYCG